MKTFPASVNRLKGKHVLVTGGAGFIGSNLTEVLLQIGASVTVLDNFATGLKENIARLEQYPNFTFVEGDITQPESYRELLKHVDVISHQAALGSVPRSIAFPYNTHLVNATGFLIILHEAKEAGVKRFVYASSSSVYGDAKASPKVEGNEGKALSPYAVTKQLNEEYAGVYNRLHGMETIGLRYFNVFGPHQNPEGVYAAAIPKFLDKIVHGGEIVVNGDGEQTRDFTYVKNAILANLLALSATESTSFGKVYNVGCGRNLSLNEVIQALVSGVKNAGKEVKNTLVHGPDRAGDIRDSLAATGAIENDLAYFPLYSFEEGIAEYLEHALK